MTNLIIPTWLLLAFGLVLPSGSNTPALRPEVVIAGRIVAADGSLKESAAIIIKEGRIKSIEAIGEETTLAGPTVADWSGAVVSPGFIDVRSKLGAFAQDRESVSAIDPAISMADAWDRGQEELKRALAEGVTAALIGPAENNLVSGVGLVVRTGGCEGSECVLRQEGPLHFALGSSVLESERQPTSRIGALAMIRVALEEAARGGSDQRLGRFVRGELDGVFVCEEIMDVSSALRLPVGRGRFALVYGGADAGLAEELADSNVNAVVVGPLSYASSERELVLPAVLSREKIDVALGGGLPGESADALRRSASLAVRYGMEPAMARRAVTSIPAGIAGVGDRLGTLEPGKLADLVVFSGDPLNASSRVLAVYISGRRVILDRPELPSSQSRSRSLGEGD